MSFGVSVFADLLPCDTNNTESAGSHRMKSRTGSTVSKKPTLLSTVITQ